MQRAAASSSNQSTPTPSRTPASAPASKRRRIDIQSQSFTPSPTVKSANELASTPDARFDPGTQNRPRGPREGDETEWVAKFNLPQTKPQAGQLDAHSHNENEVSDEEDEIWANQGSGRQTYGSFKRKKAQTTSTAVAKESNELSSASDSDASISSFGSSKVPQYDQARNAQRVRATQGPVRSAQAPKRFFDQMSLDGARTKDMSQEKQRKKQQHHRKKPRITI